MEFIHAGLAQLHGVIALGGFVVACILGLSVISLAVIVYKLGQFAQLRLGARAVVEEALRHWDAGDRDAARLALRQSRGLRADLARTAMRAFAAGQREDAAERMQVEAGRRLFATERGFRLLDSIAQVAPLLGLFGTVLGMIQAFQKVQEAGSSVDPSILAGGIWTALMTTAAGLAVAMPTSLILTWFEARVARERIAVASLLETVFRPGVLPPGRPRT